MSEADALAQFANVDPTLARLVVMECGRDNLSVLELRRRRRDDPELAAKRRRIARRARQAGYSLPQIGRAVNRDHTVILDYCRDMTVPVGAQPELELEAEVLRFCEQRGMSLHKFSINAIGHDCLMRLGRRGKPWRRETVTKVRSYMAEVYAAEDQEALPFDPCSGFGASATLSSGVRMET